MGKYVSSPDFKKLNVGMALDEGLGTLDEEIPVYFAERNPFVVKFHCSGNPGHGSLFIENTAAAKVQYMINKMLKFRQEQKKLFEEDPKKALGNVTTVNMTFMSGGLQMNVVPNELCIGFDIRVSPTRNIVEFQKMLENWMEEAGGGIRMEFVYKFLNQSVTSVSPDDPWYQAFQLGVQAHKLKVTPQVLCAVTDSRYLREVDIPVLGFSPMIHTPVLAHDHDEFLNENIFLKGIEIYRDIITELASV